MPRACASCDYFANPEPGSFQCRKSHPQLVILPPQQSIAGAPSMPGLMGTWSPTNPGQWCGEWRQRVHAFEDDGMKAPKVVTPEA